MNQSFEEDDNTSEVIGKVRAGNPATMEDYLTVEIRVSRLSMRLDTAITEFEKAQQTFGKMISDLENQWKDAVCQKSTCLPQIIGSVFVIVSGAIGVCWWFAGNVERANERMLAVYDTRVNNCETRVGICERTINAIMPPANAGTLPRR